MPWSPSFYDLWRRKSTVNAQKFVQVLINDTQGHFFYAFHHDKKNRYFLRWVWIKWIKICHISEFRSVVNFNLYSLRKILVVDRHWNFFLKIILWSLSQIIWLYSTSVVCWFSLCHLQWNQKNNLLMSWAVFGWLDSHTWFILYDIPTSKIWCVGGHG